METKDLEIVRFPCPACGTYEKPDVVTKGNIFIECRKCGMPYQANIKKSFNFRRFCSSVAKKPNRSQSYYTSLEKEVRRMLVKNGYHPGIDFIHNCLMANGRSHYYIDFYIPREELVIECSPEIWHKRWNREKSDARKYEFLRKWGLRVVEVNEKNYRDIEKILEWSKS